MARLMNAAPRMVTGNPPPHFEDSNCQMFGCTPANPKEPTVSVSQITFKIEVQYVPGPVRVEGWEYILSWASGRVVAQGGYATKGDAKSAAEFRATNVARQAQESETYQFTPII